MNYFKRKWEKFKVFAKDNKKNLIIVGCLLIGILVVNGVGGMVRGIFIDSLTQINNSINVTQNNISTLRNTIEGAGDAIGNDNNGNIQYEYIGDKAVRSKWQTDNVIFQDFITPAFNYSSGTDYDEHRQVFVDALGANHRFITSYMQPYRNCVDQDELLARPEVVEESFEMNAGEGRIEMYPIEITNDFNYTYLAIIDVPSNTQYKDLGTAKMAFIVTIDNDVITRMDYYAIVR